MKRKNAGKSSLAKLVKKAKDGEGYDILSYTKSGKKKHIEVKGTSGGKRSPFYLSINELDFMRLNKNTYNLYRVYDYDKRFNSGKFFVLKNEVEKYLDLEPVLYSVSIK